METWKNNNMLFNEAKENKDITDLLSRRDRITKMDNYNIISYFKDLVAADNKGPIHYYSTAQEMHDTIGEVMEEMLKRMGETLPNFPG